MLLRLYSDRLDKKMNLCNKETGITTVSISVGGNVMNKNIIGVFSKSCPSAPDCVGQPLLCTPFLF